MRSQKQINKAPRPHKATSSARGWSGGPAGFIPAPDMAAQGGDASNDVTKEKENRQARP